MIARTALVAGILLSLVTAAGSARADDAPQLEGFRAEVYRTVSDVELKLYIREPEGHTADDSRSAIVFFFGGGWKSGSPTQFEQHCIELAKRGMVAITADYRVLSRHRTAPRDAVEDAKAAIRYVRENADRLGIDPKRIVASGGSAGGHLAAATALVPGFDPKDTDVSSRPNALALFNPAVMLAPLDGVNPLGEEKAADIAERTGGKPIEISPIHHVREGLPPTIIFHGTKDTAVPYETITLFAERMKEAGNRCLVDTYEGRPHGFFNYKRSKEDYAATMRRLGGFLVDHGFLADPDDADAESE